MLCAVYKSNIKTSAYLYVKCKDEFGAVPEALLKQFGQPVFVMMLDLSKRKALALANIEKVCESLQTDGFYLQLPPSIEAIAYIRNQNSKIF